MSFSNSHFVSLPFKVAAGIWDKNQRLYWKESTADSYEKYIHRLNRVISDLRLDEISIDHFREYQRINSASRENGQPRLVASSINHDLNTVDTNPGAGRSMGSNQIFF